MDSGAESSVEGGMETGPWHAVTALVDPVRRALYDYVRRQGHPVTREEAADAQEISRNLAAFHLDKLVDVGLLDARYEAPEDQPRGRGRTPKVYEPAGQTVNLTIPQRQYELIAAILADAVASHPNDAASAARHEARARGLKYGHVYAATVGHDIEEALAALGFEPSRSQDRVVLRNCPFHSLASRQPELVCGLNHAFVDGVLDGLKSDRAVSTHLVPHPDACCVELRSKPSVT
jgi:predicted ArsR family transcriptional regulator